MHLWTRLPVLTCLVLLPSLILGAQPAPPNITPLLPLSTDDPPLPHTSHPVPLTPLWSPRLTFPYATNTWWVNAVLQDGQNPVYSKPYFVQFTQLQGVVLAYPRKYVQPEGHYLAQWFEFGLGVRFGPPACAAVAAAAGGAQQVKNTAQVTHQVVAADPMSVTVEYQCGASNPSAVPEANTLRVPVVRGSPYVTLVFQGPAAAPSLYFAHCELAEVVEYPPRKKADTTPLPRGELRLAQGSSFLLRLNTSQSWLLYSDGGPSGSRGAQFWWNSTTFFALPPGKKDTSKPWTIRLAALPFPTSGSTGGSGNLLDVAKEVLDRGAGCVPVGSTVDTDTSESALHVRVSWLTSDSGSSDSGCQPLILALPHTMDLLSAKAYEYSKLRYDTVLGNMTGVFSRQWSWVEPFVQPHSFHPSLRRAPVADPHRAAIETQLEADLKFVGYSPDPYDFGKQICRYARLAVIAEQLQLPDLHARALAFVRDAFEPWLKSSGGEAIMYDTTYGGTPPRMGLLDAGADFGAGWYNDHHFHYGYWLYAAAVLAKNNSEWAQSTKPFFLSLARDIANPSAQDPYFPRYRHFDWFEGHAMASGLFPFFDGRNQESSSESMNAWYGLALYGTAINDSNVERTGRALLATELRSAKRYWHSTSKHTVYPELFARRKWTGMVWCAKVVDNTWFGSGALYSLGINMLPFTPFTEHYLTYDWVTEAYPRAMEVMAHEEYTSDWTLLVTLMHAVLDPKASWQELTGMSVRSDEGMSRSNAMWWIASRPDSAEAYASQDSSSSSSFRGGDDLYASSLYSPSSLLSLGIHRVVILVTLVACVAGFALLVAVFVGSTKSPTQLWPHLHRRSAAASEEASHLLPAAV